MPFRPIGRLNQDGWDPATLNQLYNQHFNSLPEADESYFPAAFSALP
jgi:hypothetical protein